MTPWSSQSILLGPLIRDRGKRGAKPFINKLPDAEPMNIGHFHVEAVCPWPPDPKSIPLEFCCQIPLARWPGYAVFTNARPSPESPGGFRRRSSLAVYFEKRNPGLKAGKRVAFGRGNSQGHSGGCAPKCSDRSVGINPIASLWEGPVEDDAHLGCLGTCTEDEK
jgi:hypothetical protein